MSKQYKSNTDKVSRQMGNRGKRAMQISDNRPNTIGQRAVNTLKTNALQRVVEDGSGRKYNEWELMKGLKISTYYHLAELRKYVYSSIKYDIPFIEQRMRFVDHFIHFRGQEVPSSEIFLTSDLFLQNNLLLQRRLKYETRLGQFLQTNMVNIANRISEIAGEVAKYPPQLIRQHAQANPGWAGTRGWLDNKPSLDTAVYESTLQFAYFMNKVDPDWRRKYPDCNILKMRDSSVGIAFSFDDVIENVEPSEWPEATKNNIYSIYCLMKGEESQYLRDEFINFLCKKSKAERNEYLTNTLYVRYSVSTDTTGESNALFATQNPRGTHFQQSHSGSQFNVITFAAYRAEAEFLGKPVLSGPSGTAFRYVSAWVRIRKEAERLFPQKSIPTVNQAILVIMGNLLPPRAHHSYHEIMDGINGIEGFIYADKKGYSDLTQLGLEVKDVEDFNPTFGGSGKKPFSQRNANSPEFSDTFPGLQSRTSSNFPTGHIPPKFYTFATSVNEH